MRIFGLVGLLVAVLIVGLLVKKQFTSVAAPTLPPGPTTPSPAGSVKDQSQQIQQQYKQAIDAAMQQPRKLPEE
ncbi:hypothetical protein [Variovorax sp. PAMC 28711]|uniref:hypothetical protein n=1 Tax=Variovorax sp. PAMC 28711 TaxID=1795631 RepID=UPI00078E7023|nr:hypothetical protein [Variovorax sp. PAMC 28711]AMM26342.1 hypothetical protein AX767_19785 [Variovorax sp. PAMC 28711]